jgi:spermidine/putrescine-binding protein
VTELGDPAWKDSIVWLDDPYTTIQGFASTLGFPNPTELTRSQLDQVVAAAEPVMANVVSIASSFGDATDLLVRGDASISPIGWRVMVQEGAKRGTKLVAENMKNFGVAFCDTYALPSESSNVTTAQAYANAVISPKINAALAASLQSGAVTKPAYELLDRENQELYDYGLVTDPNYPVKIVNSLPPVEPGPGIMGSKDWQQAWNGLKSS